ncbi:MAG: alpha/beta hydrolase [Clostridia bacterium]|nr:alpha/beta hydrolase [Clostridia bacterium]
MNPIELTYDEKLNLKLDLWLPEAGNPPIFIYMHGGGIENGDKRTMVDNIKRMVSKGIAVASLNYRMYPTAKYPEFIDDCAKGIDFLLHGEYQFSRVFVGGSSAGSYLSMMLLFDHKYLGRYGLNPLDFDGWVLDAGQPTVHFNVLRERGLDTRLVRIDEAAPLWHITKNFNELKPDGKLPMILNISASNDMTCRLEQLKLLNATLLHFNYPKDRLRFAYMNGYNHCGYTDQPIFAEMVESIIL